MIVMITKSSSPTIQYFNLTSMTKLYSKGIDTMRAGLTIDALICQAKENSVVGRANWAMRLLIFTLVHIFNLKFCVYVIVGLVHHLLHFPPIWARTSPAVIRIGGLPSPLAFADVIGSNWLFFFVDGDPRRLFQKSITSSPLRYHLSFRGTTRPAPWQFDWLPKSNKRYFVL